LATNTEKEKLSETKEQEEKEKSSTPPGRELFQFSVPEYKDIEVVVFQDEDGVIRARTTEEVEKVEK